MGSDRPDIAVVVRADLAGLLGNVAEGRGKAGDPRYPTAPGWRQALAFTFDMALHAALAGAAAVAVTTSRGIGYGAATGFGVYLVASALHRIAVQRIAGATAGKALTGLCVIRDDTGGPVGLWLLAKLWLLSVFVVVALLASG